MSQSSRPKLGERALAKSGSSASYYNPFEVGSEGKSFVPSEKSRLVDTSSHQVFQESENSVLTEDAYRRSRKSTIKSIPNS